MEIIQKDLVKVIEPSIPVFTEWPPNDAVTLGLVLLPLHVF